MLVQVAISADELLDDYQCFGFGHFLAFFQNLLEGTFVAELLEKVDIV